MDLRHEKIAAWSGKHGRSFVFGEEKKSLEV